MSEGGRGGRWNCGGWMCSQTLACRRDLKREGGRRDFSSREATPFFPLSNQQRDALSLDSTTAFTPYSLSARRGHISTSLLFLSSSPPFHLLLRNTEATTEHYERAHPSLRAADRRTSAIVPYVAS